MGSVGRTSLHVTLTDAPPIAQVYPFRALSTPMESTGAGKRKKDAVGGNSKHRRIVERSTPKHDASSHRPRVDSAEMVPQPSPHQPQRPPGSGGGGGGGGGGGSGGGGRPSPQLSHGSVSAAKAEPMDIHTPQTPRGRHVVSPGA